MARRRLPLQRPAVPGRADRAAPPPNHTRAAAAGRSRRAHRQADRHAAAAARHHRRARHRCHRRTAINPDRFGAKPADAAYGAFQRGLYKTAYNLALPRAENGDPAAQTLVAEILSRGLGVPRNAAEAAKWYALAAEQGIPEAQFQYALMLLDGRFVKKDAKDAYALMQAAAEAGNRLAQFNFAQMLVQQDPGDAGLGQGGALLRARRRDRPGRCAIRHGPDLRQRRRRQDSATTSQARRLLVQAARQNYDTAQFDLGAWMVDGRGGARDLKSGFGWMKRAAEGGNVAAQNRLAKLYMGGIGTEPDLDPGRRLVHPRPPRRADRPGDGRLPATA